MRIFTVIFTYFVDDNSMYLTAVEAMNGFVPLENVDQLVKTEWWCGKDGAFGRKGTYQLGDHNRCREFYGAKLNKIHMVPDLTELTA